MEELPVQRPGSIRSVASNSSLASCVSLSRRPRTRARSRTASNRPDAIPPTPASDLPYLNACLSPEPLEDGSMSLPDPLTASPARPPRSPQRLDATEIRSSDTASSQGGTAADATFVEAPPSSSNPGKPSKAAKVASNLPLLDTGYRPTLSAFSRDPALTPTVNVRDSVSTQKSGNSSSLYPPSTSTASGPESPSTPRFMAHRFDSIHDTSCSPEVNEVQEYDSDDVSYRLRLLVKNNYFLPPAHSKPSPADFASSSLNPDKKAAKATAPTFLDIFRVGKSKSKPTTPTGPTSGFDPTVPMLRTTSDSITAFYTLRTQTPRSSPQLLPHLLNAGSRGRVVVVREKMNDIAVAAKQAEQDLKTRGVRIEHGSQNAKSDAVDDIIDPTDAVDIPLPSTSYPFAVQASALHGLGVLESVGADALADRLPPTKNPNMSVSYDPAEESWRKALLHQAVHHSLDNMSTFSHIPGTSTPLGSPRPKSADTPRMDTRDVSPRLIQQKILAQPMIDVIESTPSKHKRQKSAQSQASTSKGGMKGRLTVLALNTSHDSSRPPSYLPQRVDTPTGPMTPLGPPPRRQYVNPLYSLSQTDLSIYPSTPRSPHSLSEQSLHPSLRRTVSSPLLAEGCHYSASRHDLTTPPPMPPYTRDSQATIITLDTVRGSYQTGNETAHESEDEDAPRPSLTLSAPSRPSLSDYSQASMSPTTSTFQDMLNHEEHSGSSSSPGPSRLSIEQQNAFRGSPSLRYTAMSPPPRMSSSLAHVALPPPPRSSSLSYQLGVRSQMSSSSLSAAQSTHTRQAESEDPAFQIVAPEPTTPPLPEPRGQSSFTTLSLSMSNPNVPVAIHSAPGPSSPTSFFDTIQAQPNAMDDLESSDESDDDAHEPSQTQPRLFADSRHRAISSVAAADPRPVIMKHGNFSTPYIRSGESYRQNMMPIANVPLRSSKNEVPPSTSYDFFKYAQDHPPPPPSALATESSDLRRPSTADHVTTWRNNQRAQESLRKLDGMLIRHMEDEKDTIKRIATTLKQPAQS